MPRSGRVPRPPPAPGASTPAHAGPTRCPTGGAAPGRLYPRARGADASNRGVEDVPLPLPPRTRGQRQPVVGRIVEVPSTPAHAGPAVGLQRRPRIRALYPRARGAGRWGGPLGNHTRPLPPRTRGRHWVAGPFLCPVASTPAHAGPAATSSGSGSRATLYPRARGAGRAGHGRGPAGLPLPPRTRGRLDAAVVVRVAGASTPAHAGPAPRSDPAPAQPLLYPRARGAGGDHVSSGILPSPLPPRTRGRLEGLKPGRTEPASTPAHAGPALEYR